MTRRTRTEGRLLFSSTWLRKARLKSAPATLARLIPRSMRSLRTRSPRLSPDSRSASMSTHTLHVGARIEAAVDRREVAETRGGDDAGVLDADSAQTFEVEAGLHRHDVALVEGNVGRPEVGQLVNVEADAVTGRVDHHRGSRGRLIAGVGGSESTLLEDPADLVVDRPAGDAGTDHRDRRIERREHPLVHPLDHLRHLANDDGTGQIHAVVGQPTVR